MNEIRQYLNVVESLSTEEEGGLGSPSLYVLADYVQDMHQIISALKELTDVLSTDRVSPTSRELAVSGIHNLKQSLSTLLDEVHQNLNEELGTSKMAPSLDSDGVRKYDNPEGDSFPEKNGFTG